MQLIAHEPHLSAGGLAAKIGATLLAPAELAALESSLRKAFGLLKHAGENDPRSLDKKIDELRGQLYDDPMDAALADKIAALVARRDGPAKTLVAASNAAAYETIKTEVAPVTLAALATFKRQVAELILRMQPAWDSYASIFPDVLPAKHPLAEAAEASLKNLDHVEEHFRQHPDAAHGLARLLHLTPLAADVWAAVGL